MVLLLLSLIILVAQGFLGMADWWVLSSNWIMSGLICMCLTAVLNNQHLLAFNHISVCFKAWVLLASILNLSAIYVEPSLSQGQMFLSSFGYAGLFMAGFCCWMDKQMTVRALLLGAIIGLLTLAYIPSLLWIIIPIMILIYTASWSKDNLACIFTGLVSIIWINYCLMHICSGEANANSYIISFASTWGSMSYGMPILVNSGYTGWCFLAFAIVWMVIYIILGVLLSNLNSLRIRSNISLVVMVSILTLMILPSCWQLFLALIGITLCIHLLLSLGNEPTRVMIKWSDTAIYSFLFMGIGEYLIRLIYDYISTISFTLPFDIPFLN